MTPQLDGGLGFPVLLALMLAALLLRSALAPRVPLSAFGRRPGTRWEQPGIVLGLVLSVGGLLLMLTVLSLR